MYTFFFIPRLERGGVEVGKNTRLLQLQLRESEHLAEKVNPVKSTTASVSVLRQAFRVETAEHQKTELDVPFTL